ncbi:MAG: hypothetical protein JSS02_20060 [Planctomycetes bacterium]|nr:hypothetical protein [Planctomycetota bacterium]
MRFVLACGIGVGVLLIIVGSRGRITELLANFEASLSVVSAFALGFILPTAVLLLFAMTLAVEFMAENPAVKNRWNAVAIGLGLTLFVIYVLGAGLPLLKLLEALS